MCGRYALNLRPSQVRAYLENEDMAVYDAPEDVGDHAPRQSYNFAPGYHGIVYRADTPDYGAGQSPQDRREGNNEQATDSTPEGHEVRYKLQSMKWGLIPFWTKRNPDYGSMMKTINCRDDSLIENKGMWTSMKNKKRCIVVAQGFYEWLKKGKEKVPHFVKRKDEKLMCFAGLWDCVQYEGEEDKHYTYTIITTDSNKQLKFLHDRMPVILENGSKELRTWLDPHRSVWSKDLQHLLRPFDGELEVYPVSKEVGKVGNNSPNFIIPIASSENKSNIANFFAKGAPKDEDTKTPTTTTTPKIKDEPKNPKERIKDESPPVKHEPDEDRETIDHEGTEDNAPLPVPKAEHSKTQKRDIDDVPSNDEEDVEPPLKAAKMNAGPVKESSPTKSARKTRSSTSNNTASPAKVPAKGSGSQKITSFFKK